MSASLPPTRRAADREAVALRAATRDDIAAVRALAHEVWWHHYPGLISNDQIEYMLERGYCDPVLARFLTTAGAGLELATAPISLVGFAAWYLAAEREAKLDKLYVHSRWQRCGVGGALIDRVAERSRSAGCATLVLNVNKRNSSAQAAYRKHGFVVRQAVQIDIGGGYVMDDYVMALPL